MTKEYLRYIGNIKRIFNKERWCDEMRNLLLTEKFEKEGLTSVIKCVIISIVNNGKFYIDEVYPFVVESSCLQGKWIHWCTNLDL